MTSLMSVFSVFLFPYRDLEIEFKPPGSWCSSMSLIPTESPPGASLWLCACFELTGSEQSCVHLMFSTSHNFETVQNSTKAKSVLLSFPVLSCVVQYFKRGKVLNSGEMNAGPEWQERYLLIDETIMWHLLSLCWTKLGPQPTINPQFPKLSPTCFSLSMVVIQISKYANSASAVKLVQFYCLEF